MRIIDSVTLPNSHALLVVETSSSRCGRGPWSHPVRLALVETDGTPYRHARARNVLRTLAVEYPDGRYKGPRSYHASVVARLCEMMTALAAEAGVVRVGGSDVPPDAIEITAADLDAAAKAAGGAR